ncbi:acetylornithine aminotransferase-like protein [Trichodelitschia bisporula]|uniref:acetylornithine transaminase n=1 Tax=Trichodelitschia bisporula TaxID=703511 RepID=A0A6G1HW06_9PEZI|nr:acetylornithine aminotransferase-like protein [Trichodelitschia bisporula]
MALRLPLRQLGALSRASRRYASGAAAAAGRTTATKSAKVPNPDPTPDSRTARLVDEQLRYMVPTYVRPPPMFVRGSGCHVEDADGRAYLDFTAGIAVTALGHSDPQIADLIYQQANTILHTSNLYHNPWTGALSKLLVEKTREAGGMEGVSRVFICNSGSEANEAALKFARKAGKLADPSGAKHEVVSFRNSFHGRTMGSLSATPNPKYQQPFSPMVPGFHYGDLNDIDAIPHLVTEKTCGVIVEPIQGEGGVNVATPEFLTALARRCREVGALLIHDEIQCGLGRTGEFWAHAALPASAHPDMITTAKALGNGVPIGATIVTERVSSLIATGDHGTTFGGNPLACAVAHHIVQRLAAPEMAAAVAERGAQLRAAMEELQKRFPEQVGEVRGRGLLLGLQLNADPTPIVNAARERGLLIITCGKDTLRFVPPLVISEREVEEGMRILGEAMEAVFEK